MTDFIEYVVELMVVDFGRLSDKKILTPAGKSSINKTSAFWLELVLDSAGIFMYIVDFALA